MTKIYSMKNKHPERQPQKAISSGCSFQRYFSSSLLLVIHKRLVLTPASYVDDSGETISYSINMSGEDGSVILTEFLPCTQCGTASNGR